MLAAVLRPAYSTAIKVEENDNGRKKNVFP